MNGNVALSMSVSPRETVTPAAAYLLDADTEGVVRRCFSDLGFDDAPIVRGGVDTAIDQLTNRGWPRFLLVDVSDASDPMPQINRLAEVCDPETEVLVIGNRNDIVLYRDLRAAGVAEYFFKPLVGSLLARALSGIASGRQTTQTGRSGRLIFLLGVRGGVGTTTIATNLGWHFAEELRRRVLLLDLNLQNGDAALQFDAQPSHALREALEDPGRIDELFLERGVTNVTKRLSLMASLEPLADPLAVDEKAVMLLLQKLLQHYRYVVVDLPRELVPTMPALLHMPSTLLLVGDGGIAAVRDTGRWRELLGSNTAERTMLHILNKQGADGALPPKEMLRMIPQPDITFRWDRQVMTAASLGTKETQRCGAIRDGIAALSRQLSGVAEPERRSLWHRMFG